MAADGALYRTNPVEMHAYHITGWNRRSVGVCFVGNFMDRPPQAGQVRAGARLIAWLLAQLIRKGASLDAGHVVGHGELVATACPGRQWLQGARWKDSLVQEIDSWLTATG